MVQGIKYVNAKMEYKMEYTSQDYLNTEQDELKDTICTWFMSTFFLTKSFDSNRGMFVRY